MLHRWQRQPSGPIAFPQHHAEMRMNLPATPKRYRNITAKSPRMNRASEADDGDPMAVLQALFRRAPIWQGRRGLAGIEQDQGTLVEPQTLQIGGELAQPLGERIG